MSKTSIRRSLVRTYVAIAAGQHKRMAEQRTPTSTYAREIIEKEDWGPSPASHALSVLTLGLHLAIQFPVLRMWHRDKLLRVGKSLCFKVMDAFMTNADQEHGMIPAVASYIHDILRKKDATFVECELNKVIDIDDRLNEEELEYMMAMVSILKELSRKRIPITVEAVSAEARKRLVRMAQENLTMEFTNGGGLRQVEYREDQCCLCMRNTEVDEVIVERKRELKRDSESTVIEISAAPEGQTLSVGGISNIKEVFSLRENEVEIMTSKKEIRGPWVPLIYISDIDQRSDDCTARVWYMILNHSTPEKFSFHAGQHAWALRPSTAGDQRRQKICVDKEISSSEMKCSPLKIQNSTDATGKEWVHPFGTKVRRVYIRPYTLIWEGQVQFERW